MALVSSRHWDNDPFWRDWPARRWNSWESTWRDRFSRDWEDWPVDWPRPRDLLDRVSQNLFYLFCLFFVFQASSIFICVFSRLDFKDYLAGKAL